MDALGIQEVAVVGFSAGGPSALKFALSYPDRCKALVMVSAISHAAPLPYPGFKSISKIVFSGDFITWLTLSVARWGFLSLIGVPLALQATLTAQEKEWVSDFLRTVLPVRMRYAGFFNDIACLPAVEQFPLGKISVPILVVHAADDPFGPVVQGQYTAQSIPQAKIFKLESGGHLLMGQHEEVVSNVVPFLREHLDI